MKSILNFLLVVFVAHPLFAKDSQKHQTISLAVTEKGFIPNTIGVKPGTVVTLNVTRKTESTCATDILVPSMNIEKTLPLNQVVTIDLGKLQLGEIRFGCRMDMMESGKIVVH